MIKEQRTAKESTTNDGHPNTEQTKVAGKHTFKDYKKGGSWENCVVKNIISKEHHRMQLDNQKPH